MVINFNSSYFFRKVKLGHLFHSFRNLHRHLFRHLCDLFLLWLLYQIIFFYYKLADPRGVARSHECFVTYREYSKSPIILK